MHRFTISLEETLAEQFDELIARKGYQNRSEAVRDMLREALEAERLQRDASRHCVASLSYVYNHHEGELVQRLTAAQHEHHDLVQTTMHVHLDHDECLETLILRGPTAAVRQFAESLIAQRGVRHGHINLVPVEVQAGYRRHHHRHLHPRT